MCDQITYVHIKARDCDGCTEYLSTADPSEEQRVFFVFFKQM